jgi:Ca-activated chloride channel homolog
MKLQPRTWAHLVAAAAGALALAACGGGFDTDSGGGSDSSRSGGPSNVGPGGGQSGGAAGASGNPGNGAPINPPGAPPPSGSGGAAGGGGPGYTPSPTGNTNVALGGAQDFGYFRRLLLDNRVPMTRDFDAAGFFAEHHTRLPPPSCGQRICLQTLLAVMSNMATGRGCTMLQLGLNSTLVADPNMRPPLNLVIVVDVSGSMNTGGKIEFVRAGLEQLVDGLRDIDKLAIITYSDRANLVQPMAEVSLRRAELRALVRGLTANGGTALHDGLKLGYEEAFRQRDSGRQNRVLLLSDGQPTIGITSTPEILTMSRGFNSEGMGLTTIGVGTDFNPELMRGLAQQADGNFYFLENAGAVKEVFGQELSYFTVPVAFDLKLSLEPGALYNFGRAYGSSFWKDAGIAGGGLDVPSVFLAHRKSDSDQTPEGGRRGGGSALLIELLPKHDADDGSGVTTADVATVNVQFREPGSNRVVTDKVVINYPSPPWQTPERGYWTSELPIVQKSFVMLNIYIGIEQAVRAFHAGDRGTIIGKLRRLRAAVEDYNEEVKDQDIVADLKLLDDLISVLLRNGVIDPATPIPANPWPAD